MEFQLPQYHAPDFTAEQLRTAGGLGVLERNS